MSRARRCVACALLQFNDPRTVPAFLEAFDGSSPWVRSVAARALGRLEAKEAIEPLVALLADGNVPDAIEPRLISYSSESEEQRVEFSRVSGQIDVYEAAVESLGKLRTSRAVPLLIKVLSNRRVFAPLRGRAAEALGKIGDARALAPLLHAWQHGLEQPEAQGESEKSIQIGSDGWTRLLGNTDDEGFRESVLTGLGGINNPKAVAVLTRVLNDAHEPRNFREIAAAGLINSPDPAAAEPAINIWKDGDADRELRAAITRDLADAGQVEPLIAVLNEPDELDWIRLQAAASLGKTENPRALDALRTTIHEAKGLVRQGAMLASASIEEKASKGNLKQNPTPPAKDWVRRLAETYADNNEEYRRNEFQREVDRKSAGELLIMALNDVHPVNREWAVWTLGDWRHTPQNAQVVDNGYAPWEIAPAVPPLIKTLTDPDPAVRSAAAWVLGEIGDARAVEALGDLVERKDEPVRVRRSAAWALGEIGDARGVEVLEGVNDAEVPLQRTIERALEKLKQEE